MVNIKTTLKLFMPLAAAFLLLGSSHKQEKQWVVYDGFDGPGNGKHIVLVSGDEEYRSEEALPQLGKILAKHHGFKCTVLFAINPETGEIDPDTRDNIPGIEMLDDADLMIISLRFRSLPEDQMEHFVDYVNSGKPIIGLRTSTHAFIYEDDPDNKYAHYGTRSEEWEGGFGKQVLGETWVAHHGHHGEEATRGMPAEGMENHPLLNGIDSVWGDTDVYTIEELTGDSKVLLDGYVLTGMGQDDPIKPDTETMPLAWIKTYTGDEGKTSKIFNTTLGAASDFVDEESRRLIVNAAYWCLGMPVPEKANVDIVGDFDPTPFGFGDFKKGTMPSDYEMNE